MSSQEIAAAVLMSSALTADAVAQPAASSSPKPEIVAGNTAFACDLYARLSPTQGNLFFSPLSVSTALAMTASGARGETARQMLRALHLPASQGEAAQTGFAALLRHFEDINRAGEVELDLANSLWPQAGDPILDDFLIQTRQHYGAEITALDYRHAGAETQAQINRWVEDKTKNRIRNVIASPLPDTTQLVLVNAVYFKGKWDDPFEPRATRNAGFFSTPDRIVNVQLMTRTGWFGYAETADSQILELPYTGRALSMVVLLPKDKTPAGLVRLEKTLHHQAIAALRSKLKPTRVELLLPRFRIEWGTTPLTPMLEKLGIRDAFQGSKADFSGISSDRSFFISDVLQKAFVAVDEEGTEAAAATGGAVAASAPLNPPPVFRADHPFVFFIEDKATGSMLFMGRLADPADPTASPSP